MIREDRLLLTELARLTTMAHRLQDRGAHMGLVIDGEVAVAADQNVSGSASMIHHQNL